MLEVFEEKYIRCPFCENRIVLAGDFIVSAVCANCFRIVSTQGLRLYSEKVLPPVPSNRYGFSLGRRGMAEGMHFEVTGRVRYGFGRGFWDEWSLFFSDGAVGWLTEEEGEFQLFFEAGDFSLPDGVRLRIGDFIPTAEGSLFIREISDIAVIGAEGQLTYPVLPDTPIRLVEGALSGQILSMAFWPESTIVHRGRNIKLSDLFINREG